MAKCGRAAPASGAVDMDRGVSTRAKSCCASSTRGTDRHDKEHPFFLSNINSMGSLDADTEMESFACGGRAGVWCDRGSLTHVAVALGLAVVAFLAVDSLA